MSHKNFQEHLAEIHIAKEQTQELLNVSSLIHNSASKALSFAWDALFDQLHAAFQNNSSQDLDLPTIASTIQKLTASSNQLQATEIKTAELKLKIDQQLMRKHEFINQNQPKDPTLPITKDQFHEIEQHLNLL